jgi:hypothetical protein
MADDTPLVFLLDAAALSSATCRKGWQLCSTSHHLDTSEKLIACHHHLHQQQPHARILTLVETGGYGQLNMEWQNVKDSSTAEVISTLQCVPFGCRVTTFLIELATQRSTKGSKVAVISNDVDVVVASRVCSWHHLGFMFVDGEILLPGLNLVAGSAHASLECSPDSLSRVSRGTQLATMPKHSIMHVQKAIVKTHSGQGRSGASNQKEVKHARQGASETQQTKTPILDRSQDMIVDSELDGAALDDTPSSNEGTLKNTQQNAEEMEQPQENASPLPIATGEAAQKDACGEAMTRAKTTTELLKGAYMYADTQVDIDMGFAPPDADPASTTCSIDGDANVGPDESPLVPTIEQDGPPEVVPASSQKPAEGTRSRYISIADVVAAEGISTNVDQQHQGSQVGAVPADGAASAPVGIEPVCEHASAPTSDDGVVMGNETKPASEVVLVEELTLAMTEKENKEAQPTVPAMSEETNARLASEMSSQPAKLEDASMKSVQGAVAPQRRRVVRRLGSQRRLPSAAPSAGIKRSVPIEKVPCVSAPTFDVDVLLGNWVRNGGRTHTVNVCCTGGSEPSQIEFRPTLGSMPMPIEHADGTWSLNGYVLDEANSEKNVLRWRHTISGAVRTWWRPDAKAPVGEDREEAPQP